MSPVHRTAPRCSAAGAEWESSCDSQRYDLPPGSSSEGFVFCARHSLLQCMARSPLEVQEGGFVVYAALCPGGRGCRSISAGEGMLQPPSVPGRGITLDLCPGVPRALCRGRSLPWEAGRGQPELPSQQGFACVAKCSPAWDQAGAGGREQGPDQSLWGSVSNRHVRNGGHKSRGLLCERGTLPEPDRESLGSLRALPRDTLSPPVLPPLLLPFRIPGCLTAE